MTRSLSSSVALQQLCVVLLVAVATVVSTQAVRLCKSQPASPCCNLGNTFSTADRIRYGEAKLGLSMCDTYNDCPLCTVRSASDTALAAEHQASLDLFNAFFDQNQCWDGEIGTTPDSGVTTLSGRNAVATSMSCAHCNITRLAGATIGSCPGNSGGFEVQPWMYVVGGVALLLLFGAGGWYLRGRCQPARAVSSAQYALMGHHNAGQQV